MKVCNEFKEAISHSCLCSSDFLFCAMLRGRKILGMDTEPMNGIGLRILVVDDDPDQLETICRGLTLYGYVCVQAIHAGQALEELHEPSGRSIGLLLTDMTMPGKSGYELLQLARTFRPDLPAIAITGLAVNPDIESIRRLGVPVLQKPFDPEKLDRTIRDLIQA
jgi:CheY-like chemotaxis protein